MAAAGMIEKSILAFKKGPKGNQRRTGINKWQKLWNKK
jgi:hypothetical protein